MLNRYPIAANVSGCSYGVPNAQNPSGYFSNTLLNGQFGTVDWGDGAGPVQMHSAFLMQLATKQGATVNTATLTITNGPAAGVNSTGIAYVEAADGAVAPVGSQDALSRLFIGLSQPFTMLGAANAVTTINLTPAIQALVNRNGWTQWNQVQIHLRADNTNSSACSPGMAPALEVIAATDDQALTFAQQMVAKLEACLLANPTASTINIDGTSVAFVDVQKRLDYFYRMRSLESGERQTFTGMQLGGFQP